jgi:Cu(I)/Ag(I) efflux system membrane fusion protein
MKALMAVLGCLLLTSFAFPQGTSVVETTFRVSGRCGMCKSRIERAAKIKEVKSAKWDKKKQALTVAYVSSSVSVDSLQKRLAAVGHDTEKYRAPDSVYAALPGCCLYRDEDN